MSIKISEMIKELRLQKGISQEILAEHMGVTVQAVSKWENGLSCPDIGGLPMLADFFGVSIDRLLTGKEMVSEKNALPFPDDEIMRVVQAIGNNILDLSEVSYDTPIKLILPDISEQPLLTVEIIGNCSIDGDINGSVNAQGYVNCGNVGQSVNAAGGVNCGNVGQCVDAMGSVNCGNVGQCIDAMGGVNCANVGQSVNAEGDVHCSDVHGDVKADHDVYCRHIDGDVECGGNVILKQ